MKERKRAERCAGQLEAHGKACRQQRGDKQLKQRSSPQPKRFSQPAKKQMPAFMDRKVNVVEQRQLAPIEPKLEKQQSVESHPADKLGAGNRLPFNFRKTHLNQGISHCGRRS